MRRYVIGIILGLAVGLLFLGMALTTLNRSYTLRGSQIDPPLPAPDFVLQDGQGNDYRLSDQRGRLVLMFFGYTTCPDICPATLGEMKQVRNRLGEQADEVEFVFVTVDPARDTPERVGKYASSFDPTFVGLSGTEEAMTQVWADYGVYREERENGSVAGYLVDHSTRTYLIDRAGNLRLTYTFGTPVDDFVQDLRHLIKEEAAQ